MPLSPPRPFDGDYGHDGVYVPGPASQGVPFYVSGLALTAAVGYIQRFQVLRPMVIRSVVFNVSVAAGGNDPVDIAVYDGWSAAATLLASTGSTTGKLNSTGRKFIDFGTPFSLVPGRDYGLKFGLDNTFIGSAPQVSFCFSSSLDYYGAAYPLVEGGYVAADSVPAPGTLGAITALAGGVLLLLKESTG